MSPILQVDGAAEQEKAKYMYVEEDIMYTIEESSQELKLNVLCNPEKELH